METSSAVASVKDVADRPGPAQRSQYFPTLDGWRALAIAAVVCYHGRDAFFTHLPWLGRIAQHGYLGVDAFFAISGFLICSRLLQENEKHGSISLKNFYLRRVFRIVPPYLAALAGFAVLARLGCFALSHWELRGCLLFYRNYLPVLGPGQGYTSHFWSLAVEEHFYLLWPVLLVLLKPRRAAQAALGIALAVFAWRVLDGHYGWMERMLPFTPMEARTDARMDALLWGCLAALGYERIRRSLAHPRYAMLWLPLGAYLVAMEALHLPLLSLQRVLLFPLLLLSTVLFPGTLLGRLLESAPLRWVGALSYSLYLWQEPFLQPLAPPGSPEAVSGFAHLQRWPWNILAILLCAAASYYLLERPMVRLGHRLSRAAGQRQWRARSGAPLAARAGAAPGAAPLAGAQPAGAQPAGARPAGAQPAGAEAAFVPQIAIDLGNNLMQERAIHG